jgi:hypothetical protein
MNGTLLSSVIFIWAVRWLSLVSILLGDHFHWDVWDCIHIDLEFRSYFSFVESIPEGTSYFDKEPEGRKGFLSDHYGDFGPHCACKVDCSNTVMTM